MARKYFEKTKKEAVKLYVEGWLEKQIATKLGVNHHTVGTWLDLAGVRNRKSAPVRKPWPPTTDKPVIDWVGEIKAILASCVDKTLATDEKGIEYVQYNFLIDKATQQFQHLIDKARLSEAEWWKSNIDFVAWEKRLTQLKDQLNAKGEKK